MKGLIKIFLVTFAFFSLLMLLGFLFVSFNVQDMLVLFENIKNQPPFLISLLIIALLYLDLLITIPTLMLSILTGHFLGFPFAFISIMLGLYAVGITGYILSYFWGEKLFIFLIKDAQERQKAKKLFEEQSLLVIVFSRVIPMMPEMCSCLAGVFKMKFKKFILAWTLSSAPYALITTYSGSISTLQNPQPAIITFILIMITLGICAHFIYKKLKIKKVRKI